jgi:hypothetical protein
VPLRTKRSNLMGLPRRFAPRNDHFIRTFTIAVQKSPCKIPPNLPLPKGGEISPLLTKGDEGGLDQFLKVLKCYQCSFSTPFIEIILQ